MTKPSLSFFIMIFMLACSNPNSSPSLQTTPYETILFEEDPYVLAPDSITTLPTITQLAQLRELTTQHPVFTLTPTLRDQFPLISEKKIITLLNKFKQSDTPPLAVCPCPQADLASRFLTTLMQTQALLEKVPLAKRSKKVIHTSFGEENYRQTYFLALALSEVGFRDVGFYGIGPNLPTDSSWKIYQNLFHALPGMHLLHHYPSKEAYLADLANGKAYPSHSFDAIDVGPYHPSTSPTNPGFFNYRIQGSLKDQPENYKGFRTYFYISWHLPSQRLSCIGHFSNITEGFYPTSTFTIEQQQERAQLILQQYCSHLLQAIHTTPTPSNPENFIRTSSEAWFTPQNLKIHSFQPYPNSAWHDFTQLTETATAPQTNPVILVLQHLIYSTDPYKNQASILQGPTRYTPYFPILGGTYTVQNLDSFTIH